MFARRAEMFAESGSDMGYQAKEQFLTSLAQELRDLVDPAMQPLSRPGSGTSQPSGE
jgi:hypothetical protein